MQYTLLDSIPAVSWLGIASSIILALLAFLLKDSYASLKSRVTKLESQVEDIDERQTTYEKETNDRIHNVHLTILGKLDEIKEKYNSLRT